MATEHRARSSSDPASTEAQAPTGQGMFVDGTPNVDGCQCDRDGRLCEMPCWQRVGLVEQPCCPGCPPLPEVPRG